MPSRLHAISLALVAGLAPFAVPVLAQHEHHDKAKQAEAPPMTPEQQEMMKKWEKAMTPGPQHADLAAMAGNWEFTGTSWMTPDAPPETFTGTEERSLALGGRVLVSKVTSEFQGMPFEGHGMTGYDNVSSEWWSTWNDNMGTGVMLSTGKCSDHKCEFTGSFNDPMTGTRQTSRMVSTHEPNEEHHTMYGKTPEGKEFKAMEFVYTRKN